MAAPTSIEEITYLVDYRESILMHLEELPPLLPPTRKYRNWLIFHVHCWLIQELPDPVFPASYGRSFLAWKFGQRAVIITISPRSVKKEAILPGWRL
jgi:hypothetical protein